MATIIFNGKTYNTPDEMSATDRAAFEQLAAMFVDKDGNGIPDFLEGDIIKNVSNAYAGIVSINGNMGTDMNEMPEEMRVKVQEAFQKISDLGLVPPSSSSTASSFSSAQMGTPSTEFITSSRPITSQEYPSTIQEGNRPGVFQWIVLGALLFFCLLTASIAGLYFFMR